MPIEIRELSIKVNLNEGGGGGGNNATNNAGSGGEEAQQALVKAVIEKVLEILKEKTER